MAEQQKTVSIHVPVLTRVEGEGALHLRIRDGRIEELKLQIYEPPRFFEKFLEGRSFEEVPDLVARICGICPVAYQVTAVQALEKLFGVEPTDWARAMRRAMYCGEWIQSHSLHIHLLAAPDFFGYDSALAMARDYPEVVRRGLKLQEAGNAIMELFGARSVHPVGLKVGGFHHAPSPEQVARLRGQLDEALPLAEELVRWVAAIAMPQDEQRFTCVATSETRHYAIETGTILSSQGLAIPAEAYAQHFSEYQAPDSTALFSRLDGEAYLVGPLARLNLNGTQLPAPIQALMAETGLRFPSRNMFMSLAARAVEILYALGEARRLLDHYERPSRPAVDVIPKAGVAMACTEAPRGLLWHRYETDAAGRLVAARIVPPTSQNQGRIEEDLRLSLTAFGLEHEDSALRLHCEKVIRNYDPCISCATHFLRMNVERSACQSHPSPSGRGVGGEGEMSFKAPSLQRMDFSLTRPSGHPLPLGEGNNNKPAGKVRIIGIGSPSGDDQAGWLVVDALQGRLPHDVELIRLDRPGTGLIPLLENASHVILIDAMQGGVTPGTFRHVNNDEWANYPQGLSSHGIGVFDALKLTEELGCLPEIVEVFGIGIGSAISENQLSETVANAVERLVENVAKELMRQGIKASRVDLVNDTHESN